MEFIEWLGLLAVVTVYCFFFVFLFWRAYLRKTPGPMSRGRIVWLLLGGLSVILTGCVPAFALWHGSEPPPSVLQAGLLLWFGWGIAEFSIALRAAFARPRDGTSADLL
jgi:hypothetical protein